MEQVTESKRVLIGWQSINGALLLAGNNPTLTTPDQQIKVQNAVTIIQQRPEFTHQNDVITEPGEELSDYIGKFKAQADTLPFF